MAMLDRYKKPGGFLQLLNLIETCGPQKQEKFLAMINEEAPNWGEAIKAKVLTVQRILSWKPDTLTEVITRLQPLTLASAMQGMPQDQQDTILKLIGFSLKRQLDDLRASRPAGPGEIASAYMKIIVEVREMVSHGIIKFEKCDPELVIEENIEERLMKSIGPNSISASGDHASTPPVSGDKLVFNLDGNKQPTGGKDDTEFLKRKVQNLSQEVTNLKQENQHLAEKLAQIRKMAA